MKTALLMLAVFLCIACDRKQKDFSTVKIGMTKEEVIGIVGQPGKKNDIGIQLWVYPDADRTIVFRDDTVYSVITSAKARIDSIKNSLEKAGENVEKSLNKMGDSIDSTATSIKNKIKKKL